MNASTWAARCIWLVAVIVAFVAFFHALPHELITAYGSHAVLHARIVIIVISVVTFLQVLLVIIIGIHDELVIEEAIPAIGSGAVAIAIPAALLTWVTLLALAGLRIRVLRIAITVTASWCRTFASITFVRVFIITNVAMFINVPIAIATYLVGHAVGAAAIARLLVHVIADFTSVSRSVATGLELHAISAAAVTSDRIAVITRLLDIADSITANLGRGTVVAAAVARFSIAIVTRLVILAKVVSTAHPLFAVGAAGLVIDDVAVIADLAPSGIDDTVATAVIFDADGLRCCTLPANRATAPGRA